MIQGKILLIPNLNHSAPASPFRYHHAIAGRPEQASGSGPHQLSVFG